MILKKIIFANVPPIEDHLAHPISTTPSHKKQPLTQSHSLSSPCLSSQQRTSPTSPQCTLPFIYYTKQSPTLPITTSDKSKNQTQIGPRNPTLPLETISIPCLPIPLQDGHQPGYALPWRQLHSSSLECQRHYLANIALCGCQSHTPLLQSHDHGLPNIFNATYLWGNFTTYWEHGNNPSIAK